MSEAPSIREALEAAAAAAAEPAPEATAEPLVDAAPQATEPAEPAEASAPTRDEQGRFAKAPEQAQLPQPEAAAPTTPEPPAEETIRVPSSLPAALKGEFKSLPQEWRDAILKQEESVVKARAEWSSKGERLNRYEDIIGPHRDAWALQGLDEFEAIRRFANVERVLREQPIQAFLYLAQSYGVDLRQVASQMNGAGPAQQQPQSDPALQQLMSEFQTLKQTVTQQSRDAESAGRAEAQAAIDAFRADPKNLYFDNVATEVGQILGRGEASSLAEAYERAIWASSEIRPLLMKQQAASQGPTPAEQAQRQKAAQAARASGSVTGAPGLAVAPPAGSKGNIRADLEAAAQQIGFGV